MKKILVLTLVVSVIALATSPAAAVRRSRPGSHFSDERGTCRVTTPGEDVNIRCDQDGERNEIIYKFRIPRDARHVRVKWDDEGLADSSGNLTKRWGSQGRHLIAGLGLRSFGVFGADVTIHRVDVRYWITN